MISNFDRIKNSNEYLNDLLVFKWFNNRHRFSEWYYLIEFLKKVFRLKEKPRPLKLEEANPVLCMLIQDDSEMGKLNKMQFPDKCKSVILVSKVENGKVQSSILRNELFARFEVIAEHCPPRSNFWALYKMSEGKAITHNSFPDGYYYKLRPARCVLYSTVYDTWGNGNDAISFTGGSLELHRFIKGGKAPNDGKSRRAIGGNISFRGKSIPSSWDGLGRAQKIVMCGYKYVDGKHDDISIAHVDNSKNRYKEMKNERPIY